MELGFLESDEEGGLLLRQITSDWVSWDGGLAGGLEPIWLCPPKPQDAALVECINCKNPMTFLLQIYAPLDEFAYAFHRDLSVFICSTCNGPDSAVCVRSQLAKDNDIYPANVDDCAEDVEVPDRKLWTVFAGQTKPKVILDKQLALVVESEGPEAEMEEEDDDEEDPEVDEQAQNEKEAEHLTKKNNNQQEQPCAVCAAPTKTRCGACQRVYYCSREHQAQDWKAKHKKECLDFQDEKTSQKDLDQAASFGDNKRLEQLEASKDRMFQRFVKRTRGYPDQVLRYRRWPENNNGVLWTNSHGILDHAIPDCEHCGSSRQFEMQITPQFLSFFMKQGGHALDFGTIVVYTCTQSCDSLSGGFAKEFAFRQNVA